jgi:hypothetical protein
VTFQRLVDRVAALIAQRGIEGGEDSSTALPPG